MKRMMKLMAVFAFALVTFGVFAGANEDAVKNVIVSQYKMGVAKNPKGMLSFFTDDAQVTGVDGQTMSLEQLKMIFNMLDALKNKNAKALMEIMIQMQGIEITPEIRQKIDNLTPEEEKQLWEDIEKNSGGYDKMLQQMSDEAKKELATLKFESVTVKGNTAEVVVTVVAAKSGKLERSVFSFVRKDAKSPWLIKKQVTILVKTAADAD